MLFAPQKVAMATCHSSRCITLAGVKEYYGEIIKNIFDEKMPTLGEVVFAAKRKVISDNATNDNYYGPAVLQTILGDPALRIFNKTAVSIDKITSKKTNNQAVSVHPNPFVNNIHLKINSKNYSRSHIEIYRPDGTLINVLSFSNKDKITVGSTLRPGIYFLRVTIRAQSTIIDNRYIKAIKL